jgi:hypothetical protein
MLIALGLSLAPLGAARGEQGDPGALIGKLKSADKDEVENATADLLKLGEPALAPLREAAAKSEDAAFKKLAGGLADRIEIRKGVAGLAKSWGERWYSVYIKALKVGWARLKTEEKDGKLLLTDEVFVKESKTREASIKTAVTCEPNEYLAPVEIVLEVTTPDTGAITHRGRVKEGRLIIEMGEERKATRIPPNTVVDTAAHRLLTVMPRGAELDFALITLLGKAESTTSAVLKFDKDESIEFEGRKVKCRRFVLADGEKPDRHYWVDGEARLLRVQMESDQKDVEILLTDEKKAKDLDTND